MARKKIAMIGGGMIGGTLAHLAAITLQELIAQAPALTRIDRKYLVPETLVPALFGDLDSSARVLEINGDREFDYRSLYFDSPSLESFRGAGQRRRRQGGRARGGRRGPARACLALPTGDQRR